MVTVVPTFLSSAVIGATVDWLRSLGTENREPGIEQLDIKRKLRLTSHRLQLIAPGYGMFSHHRGAQRPPTG